MKNPLTPSATPSVLENLSQLSDGDRRERVQHLTGTELKELIEDMNGVRAMPTIFESADTQLALEQRMEALGVTMDAKSNWQELKDSLGETKATAEQRAEKTFASQLFGKAGAWGLLATGAITVLSWLGFAKAKQLRESISTKGYLRTAVEGAKDHPIFAALVAGLGVTASFGTLKYLQNNAGPITDAIAEKAKKMGVPGTDVAKSLADKLRTIVDSGVDLGMKGTVIGIASFLGGEYDEETGVVTLGHNTLHSPVVIAYQAGVRRRTGNGLLKSTYSQFVIEDKLTAILKQGQVASANNAEARAYQELPKKLLAQRGLDLLKKQNRTAADDAEIGRIVSSLETDLKLEGKSISQVQADPAESKRHLDELQTRMQRDSLEEVEGFNALKQRVQQDLLTAEENIRKGKYVGTAEDYKQRIVRDANKQMKSFRDDLTAKKITMGRAYEDALNGLEGTIGDHVRYDLDSATNGRGLTGKTLEGATKLAEKAGFSMNKLPGGKWVTRGIVGYSLVPLVLEGAAALRPGKAGEAATKALMWDATDAGIGFIPVVGELNDFRAAIMGTDLNGRELNTTSRVTAGVMGGLGTAALALGLFTGGTSIAAFKLFRVGAAARKAVRAAKLAENATTIANVTQKTLKAADKATASAKTLENMYQISKTQKIARSAMNVVHNAQRGMQIYTYGMLGFSVGSGAVELYNSAEGAVATVQKKAIAGIDAAERFATSL